jgi:hypothetical protein
MAIAALILTGAYSVSAALGSAMGGRLNAANAERDISDARKKAQASYDAAKAELDTLKPTRTVGELEALVARQSRQGCSSAGLNSKWVCPVNASLLAELSKAKRRAELEAKLDKVRADLEHMRSAKVANSDAIALAAYLNRLGFQGVEADWLNELLVLLAVLVIECGGGLSLAVGLAFGSNKDTSASAHEIRSGTPTPTPSAPIGRVSMSDPSEAGSLLLTYLRKNGGVLTATQRTLAASLGWSRSWTNKVLHDLRARGFIRLDARTTGTVVTLV